MKSKILLFSLMCFSFLGALVGEEVSSTSEEETVAAEQDSEEPLALEAEPETMASEFEDQQLIAAVDNLGPTAAGFVTEGEFGPDEEDIVDPRTLRDYVESRGLIQCRQKEGMLTIAGDVRARWIAQGERLNGRRVRGRGTRIGVNRFKSEINLFFDYAAPKTWVSTKLKFVNFAGRDGGSATKVEMERAFIGYDIFECDDYEEDFYIEVGRSNLDYVFESRVEFGSIFDGIHLFYTRCVPNVGQFTIHGGPFIVDSVTNHYAWVVETFVTKWRGTGFSFKYSLIDWNRGRRTFNFGGLTAAGTRLLRHNPRYRFLVSQMLFGYEKSIDFCGCKALFLYAAVLVNHDAKRHPQTDFRKLNGAWYVGFTLGKLCKGGDWSIDINWQSVGAQSIPEFDLSGIGHGNAAGGFLSDAIVLGLPLRAVRLFTNYQGIEANALYAVTDSLSLRAKAQYSVPIVKRVGGQFRFKSLEMSVIYAF
jgi:hypothetical protein